MHQRSTESDKSLSFLVEAQKPSVVHTADRLFCVKLGPILLDTCLGFAVCLLFVWQADPRTENLQ
jgi:hypothetical protein